FSRVAESCFWLTRYLERAENVARLIRVNQDVVLDSQAGWMPLIVVVGEQERFEAHFGDDVSGEAVQEYLTWDERNPISIVSSIRWMRENARTIREVISLETWKCANRYWTWLRSDAARALYHSDPQDFYGEVTRLSVEIQGWVMNTMMHEQPFDFMAMGRLLERASQTARTMDIKHHMLGSEDPGELESPLAAAEWSALLKSCSADEPFYKRHSELPRGALVAEFLLQNPTFPRSVLYCLSRGERFLTRIRESVPENVGRASADKLRALVQSLENTPCSEIMNRGIHNELTRVVEATAEVCNQIHYDYFDPAPGQTQSQSQD
ncbi:MAG: alpha-E domain-containing protein, partial [Myxococcota bacterium]